MAVINQQLAEFKDKLQSHKESPQFTALTSQLNRVLEQKYIEVKQKKKKKYARDLNDYKLDQVLKWQLNLKSDNSAIRTHV